jgi:hypothetical protein
MSLQPATLRDSSIRLPGLPSPGAEVLRALRRGRHVGAASFFRSVGPTRRRCLTGIPPVRLSIIHNFRPDPQ